MASMSIKKTRIDLMTGSLRVQVANQPMLCV